MCENKKTYYIRGGVKCERDDCFACEDGKCTLLKASYKADEVCPFYKPIDKQDVLFDADVSTYKYASRRVKELERAIDEDERLIRSLNYTTSEAIKYIKKDMTNKRIALKHVEKSKKDAAEKINEYKKQEEEQQCLE